METSTPRKADNQHSKPNFHVCEGGGSCLRKKNIYDLRLDCHRLQIQIIESVYFSQLQLVSNVEQICEDTLSFTTLSTSSNNIGFRCKLTGLAEGNLGFELPS